MNKIFFSEDEISTLRERSNLIEIVSDYVSLKKSGKNYKGLCPFHSEKTPSFMVNGEKQIFHCFGCGEGGNVFTFLMKIKNLTFPEAVEELAKRYGMKLTPRELSERKKKEFEKKDILLELNSIASEYFHNLLQSKKGEQARQYLLKRGIQQEIIEEHRLGYSLDQWDGLVRYLKEKKISLDFASEVGLVIPKKKEGWYDTFRNRIMFPIFDLHHRPIGFGGRLLKDGEPKYINSPESILYHKGETLYGIQVAKRYISEKDYVIIVEGYFDLLMLHQYGVKNSVATLGTALTLQHIRTLKRYTKNLYTVFDADEAGFQASIRALPLFLDEDVEGKLIMLPKGEDPDDFLRKGNYKEFQRMIAQPIPLIDFFLERLAISCDLNTIEGKVKMAKEAIGMLNRISDPIKRNLYIKALAEKIDIRESVLHDIIKQPSKGIERLEGDSKRKVQGRTFPKSEQMLIQLMIHNPEFIAPIIEENIFQEFQNINLKTIGKEIENIYLRKGRIEIAEILSGLSQDLKNLLSELTFDEFQLDREKAEKVLRDCIRKIKEERLKKDKIELLKKIREAEQKGGEKILEGLLKECQELAKREKALVDMI